MVITACEPKILVASDANRVKIAIPSEEFEMSALDESLRLSLMEINNLILSEKDRSAPKLESLKSDNFLPVFNPTALNENNLYE